MSEEVTQWEYKMVNDYYEVGEEANVEGKLNKLGAEGWEATGNRIGGYPGSSSGPGKILLKRPKKIQKNDYDYSR